MDDRNIIHTHGHYKLEHRERLNDYQVWSSDTSDVGIMIETDYANPNKPETSPIVHRAVVITRTHTFRAPGEAHRSALALRDAADAAQAFNDYFDQQERNQ